MKLFHDASSAYKAQESGVKLVKASRHTTKHLHALEKVFNQAKGFVAVLIQGALFFAVGSGWDDELHCLLLGHFDKLVLIVGFVAISALAFTPPIN